MKVSATVYWSETMIFTEIHILRISYRTGREKDVNFEYLRRLEGKKWLKMTTVRFLMGPIHL